MQFIDLAAQYQHLKSKIDRRIQTVLDHGQYIMGPEVLELENQLADYVGVKHVISCANGTDALTLVLMALGIGQGDGVLVPTFTFFASAETVAFAGATPVFVDSDPSTFNICPVDLEKRIQAIQSEGKLELKAIMTVDLFGLPANYPAIQKIADKYGLKIISDSAQGFGGEINGQRAGSFGDIATTSFFPAKPLGCYGDGGAIFTNNDDYAELIRCYRVHGKGRDKYDNVRIGVNSRLDTLQAAILLEKLAVFPDELEKRKALADSYQTQLSNTFNTPQVPTGYLSSWAQYTLVSDNRDDYIAKLKEKGIPSMVYYSTCMHQQTAFDRLGYQRDDFPVAEKLAKTVFSLPMHPYMSEAEQEQVVKVLLA
ncbi:DegT/DnrJ/EryC1/StrS family aminotransferase [Alcaligenes endophyticus]|uniref:DegT/DnrJ/EryC1/StrS family aminotransferase n=1 Tax=Alcaligenes endophyticus TaxID=1929088 RepID=A0ABT8EFS8_9BURK|nr:DegT/DnrJ/EryC1/StrS family aminotransferase [Alcaligenes endophyticus]MCX5590194.1 DegT/DnrJ/EryC1/StrS family aminotransferase [Alcaligenes endophyticus]MDN4120143.1 DegT/DnrJ/EryC1/StrS family aminotransferase [Alcaligenes endophyticus]